MLCSASKVRLRKHAASPSVLRRRRYSDVGAPPEPLYPHQSSRAPPHTTKFRTTPTAMASATNPPLTPNSCLVAILLVIRSSSGSSLPFHYPPRPRLEPSTVPSRLTSSRTDYDTSTSSSSSNSSSDDDDERLSRTNTVTDRHDGTRTITECNSDSESRTRVSRRSTKRRDRDISAERAKERDDREREGVMPWETYLGFRTDALAGIVTPRGLAGKGKFELSVDDMVFLGQPVRVRADGTWRKRKKRRKSKGKADIEDDDEDEDGEDEVMPAVPEEGGKTGPKDPTSEERSRSMSDATDTNNDADDEGDDEESSGNRKQGDTMTMFHMVFVLNPPELEYHYRVREIYEYVAKRFSRALKYEQAKDGYVWREVEKITRLKEQAAHKGIFACF